MCRATNLPFVKFLEALSNVDKGVLEAHIISKRHDAIRLHMMRKNVHEFVSC